MATDPESIRLEQDARREKNWKRWGPYLSERQWGTVREDYSANGNAWEYFPFEQSLSRAYRWGEDGLLGITDRQCRLCFATVLWNGRDPFLKERLFGLSNEEGNHGEDVKEQYFYLDATPTSSYLKALYKYPQAEFPYDWLRRENQRRGRSEPEFELTDTGIFNDERYFDVFVEYAKAAPDDLLIRITVHNRGPETAKLHLLPTLWFRNTWSWGCKYEGCWPKPGLIRAGDDIRALHVSLGRFRLVSGNDSRGQRPELLFTENETNAALLFDSENTSPHVKDAFHDYVVHGRLDAVNPAGRGTKAALLYIEDIPPGEHREIRLRLFPEDATPTDPLGAEFDSLFAERIREADEFYQNRLPSDPQATEERRISRQAYAGLLWSKQFYEYVIRDWLEGDPEQPAPPPERLASRNVDWGHLFTRDVISIPDKWEYPWFAAWDLAFHMVAFARIDPTFAKEQLLLFLREWYTHPSGQLPAYEWNFSDVNPPVHAWACWRVYKMSAPCGSRDRAFLARAFQKLLINFTWWVNRKDAGGRHLFAGGFLGLDNIGVFDRSKPLPAGGHLEQADGTAWMASYCLVMLAMALELAGEDPVYQDVASKFFEHFVAIADAMNALGGTGLWDETDGFYYDRLRVDGQQVPVRIRSLVGLIPLFAVLVLEDAVIDRLPGFKKRLTWFLENRPDLARHMTYMDAGSGSCTGRRLLAIPSRERLVRVLQVMLDEGKFLSPHGVRSLSRCHLTRPFVFRIDGVEQRVNYDPGDSTSGMFGGNSNWRGPVWMPMNYLLIEALERYHHFYADDLRVECPSGSGKMLTLKEVARELSARVSRLFLPDAASRRPCHGDDPRFAENPHWREHLLFHEFFHGDNGRGLGASHQTGWTALVAELWRT